METNGLYSIVFIGKPEISKVEVWTLFNHSRLMQSVAILLVVFQRIGSLPQVPWSTEQDLDRNSDSLTICPALQNFENYCSDQNRFSFSGC